MEEKRRKRVAVAPYYDRANDNRTRFTVTAYTEVRKIDSMGRERGVVWENKTELDLSMEQASALLSHLADRIGSGAAYDDDRLAKLSAQGVDTDV